MKKFSLFFMFALLFFLIGCGDSSDNDYDKYAGDSGSQQIHNSSNNGSNDKDKDKKSDDDADTADTASDDDGNTDSSDTETENGDDNDSDNGGSGDFWSTCEGIVACSKGCMEEDYDCFDKCISKGSAEGVVNYRNWRTCFEEKCAEDKTAECSAAQCPEFDEKCNVAEAFEYERIIPAPYGNAVFSGSFSYLLNNTNPSNTDPTSENKVVLSGFAKGNVSTMQIASEGMLISFAKITVDERDGAVVDVYQAPYDINSGTPGNPVVILRIKENSAVAGEHSVGVADESEARLIVAETDSKLNIQCYHAFGTGKFKIDEAEIKTGSSGKLKFSNGTAELFHPENIPELGGDAREILGVTACSVIDY